MITFLVFRLGTTTGCGRDAIDVRSEDIHVQQGLAQILQLIRHVLLLYPLQFVSFVWLISSFPI